MRTRVSIGVVVLSLCACSPMPSGKGWVQAAALPNGEVGGGNLLVDGDTLLVGTGKGVLRSTDDGVTWADSSAGLSTDGGTVDIEAFGVVGSTLVGGGADGTFRSADHGLHWQRSDTGMPTTTSPYAFWTVGTTMLAGMNTGADGMYRSTDGALTWTKATTGLPSLTGGVSFAQLGTTVFSAFGPDVSRTTDEGLSWSNSPSPGPSNALWLVTQGTTLFVATANKGVFKSSDGIAFTAASSGLPADIVSTLFSFEGKLYAGTDAHGVFVSADDGASWTAFSEGFPSAAPPRAIQFAVHGKTLLVVTEFGGVWRRAL